jgi:hypothetical protein
LKPSIDEEEELKEYRNISTVDATMKMIMRMVEDKDKEETEVWLRLMAWSRRNNNNYV